MKNLLIAALLLALAIQGYFLFSVTRTEPQAPEPSVPPDGLADEASEPDDSLRRENERLRDRLRELEAELAEIDSDSVHGREASEVMPGSRSALMPMRTVTDLAERGVVSVRLSPLGDDQRLGEGVIELYELEPREVESVNRALDRTWNELRRLTEENSSVSYDEDGNLVVTTEPFTEAGVTIHDGLVDQLESILGEERTRSLLHLADYQFETDFDRFGAMQRTVTVSTGTDAREAEYFHISRREETGDSTSTHNRRFRNRDDVLDQYPNLRHILSDELPEIETP